MKNYLSNTLMLGALIGSALLFAGCGGGGSNGGGGGGSTAGGGTGGSALAQAESGLNTLVFQSSTPTAPQLTPVAANYKTAYHASPTNPDAAAGYAISEAALDGLTFANEFGITIPALHHLAKASAAARDADQAQSNRLSGLGKLLILWQLPTTFSQGAVPSLKVNDLMPISAVHTAVADAASVTPLQVQTSLIGLDADLAKDKRATPRFPGQRIAAWFFCA